jgi:hypothetical protein
MKKVAITLLILGLSAGAAFASNDVRLSQVYTAGGNSGALYNQDFIELFNSSAADIDISGWSLQYGSATGTAPLGSCTNCFFQFPEGSIIHGCSYLLVGGSTGSNGVPLPVALDHLSTIGLGASAGKIGLKADGVFTPIVPCDPTLLVDMLGYGTTANCFEGAGAGPVPSPTLAAWRLGDGLTDTDDNSLDFFTATPAPRNSQSPVNPDCNPVAVDPTSWGQVKSTYR